MPKFPSRLKRDTLHGWNTVSLANGLIEAVVVPEIGGRIIQLRLGQHEFLYVNPRHLGRIYPAKENCAASGWKNYGGSKVWPAPQGWERTDQWPGPPDPVLDGGPYSFRIVSQGSECVAVSLESPHDEYTGLTFSREIRLRADCSTVQMIHKMRNSSSRAVRWGIWQVTQQDASLPLAIYAPARHYRQMFGDQPFQHVHLNHDAGLWQLDYADRVAKFAVHVERGWLVAMRPNHLFALVETFPLFPDCPYPDGAPVELWVNGQGTFTLPAGTIDTQDDPNGCDAYIETEALSPLVELKPGEEFSFPICWHATRVASPLVSGVSQAALISEPPTVERDGSTRLTGAFGFFEEGVLELSVLAKDHRVLEEIEIRHVSPGDALRLNHPLRIKQQARKISLRLRIPSGKLLADVAELPLDA